VLLTRLTAQQQHHREAPAEDPHLGVLDVQPMIEQHSGYPGDDARPITADRCKPDLVHA
jgi:hypothetical protein